MFCRMLRRFGTPPTNRICSLGRFGTFWDVLDFLKILVRFGAFWFILVYVGSFWFMLDLPQKYTSKCF